MVEMMCSSLPLGFLRRCLVTREKHGFASSGSWFRTPLTTSWTSESSTTGKRLVLRVPARQVDLFYEELHADRVVVGGKQFRCTIRGAPEKKNSRRSWLNLSPSSCTALFGHKKFPESRLSSEHEASPLPRRLDVIISTTVVVPL